MSAETRDTKAQKTTDEANAVIAAERQALRAKTERLKALRLAQEGATGFSELDKKPAKVRPAERGA